MKKETYADMADLSIAQTMVRSINTSICVLLPLLAILIFGGPTLKDFAFALTIGVITGTYSSFFVATPLAVLWKEREPRYRRRLVAAGAAAADIALEPAALVQSAPNGGKAAAAKSSSKAVQPRASQKAKKGTTSGKKPAGKAPKRTPR
jgi:SecD/SecF fusion protein